MVAFNEVFGVDFNDVLGDRDFLIVCHSAEF